MSTRSNASRLRNVLLSLVVGLTCLRVWVGPTEVLPRAQAQIPDSGLQRNQLLAETRKTNELLAEIVEVLKTQAIKVTVESSDKSKAGLSGLPAHRG